MIARFYVGAKIVPRAAQEAPKRPQERQEAAKRRQDSAEKRQVSAKRRQDAGKSDYGKRLKRMLQRGAFFFEAVRRHTRSVLH